MSRRLAQFDLNFYSSSIELLAGIDEAGRGPLAGPVVAAACSMPANLIFNHLDDSKRLSDKTRRSLDRELRNHPQVVCALAFVGPEEIDTCNIHIASLIAMARALQNLQGGCDYLLVDGRFAPHLQKSVPMAISEENCRTIVKGDGRSQVIAAASILAKVARDDYMCQSDQKWPAYGFAKHKGYPTREHLAALSRCGPCPLHRRSFRLNALANTRCARR